MRDSFAKGIALGDFPMKSFFPHSQSIHSLKSYQASLISALDEVIKQRGLNSEMLAEFQTSRLKTVLEYAYQTIPFSHRKYDSVGFHPDQFRSLEDIGRIPLLTKRGLRETNLSELCDPRGNEKALELATSGSSGSPIRVCRSESSMWLFSAYNLSLYYEWCQGKPFANVLYFIDPTSHTIDYALGEQLRATVGEDRIQSAFAPLTFQQELVLELQPEFISSYPTTMRNIAGWFDRRGETISSLKLLHLTSESIDPLTRRMLMRVFPDARIVESYTSTEAGLVGYSCLTDRGFHVTETQVYAEIIDEKGAPTKSTGRIVVTDLTNRSTPIIRYVGLDDYCRWAQDPCGCKTPNRRIAEMEGRLIDSIVLANGATQSPYTLTNAMGTVAGVLSYQIVQENVSSFRVRIVPDPSRKMDESAIADQIRTALSTALNERISCQVVVESEILPPPGAHKLPLVISLPMRQR
jgi:phenylacetate-CoA ligase